nr:hypothetical protein [uncultured Brumimicrobium sp.]
MANSYSKTAPGMVEDKQEPSKTTLQFILNYSKSIEVKKSKKESVMIHLN